MKLDFGDENADVQSAFAMRRKILENISINLFVKAIIYLASFVTVLYVTRVL